MNTKPFIILILILLLLALGGYLFYADKRAGPTYNINNTSQQSNQYYDQLDAACNGSNGCEASVSRMRANNYKQAESGTCPEGFTVVALEYLVAMRGVSL